MQFSKNLMRWRSAFWMAAAIGVAGCNKDMPAAPGADGPQGGDANLSTGVEVSSRSAKPGESVLVTVVQDAQLREPVIALQGYVRFDPARLEYLGQQVEQGTMVVLNDQQAARGSLRLVSLKLPALQRTAAGFVFRVKSEDYTKDLKFQLEVASTPSAMEITRSEQLELAVAPAGAELRGRRVSTDEWTQMLVGMGYASDAGDRSGMSLAGAGFRFGDVNLSTTINAGDVTYLGNVAVGNITLNDPALNRDGVIAGNVAPANLPGLGEPGDGCRPGVACTAGAETGPGAVNAADIGQIAQEAVGTNVDVVGENIPGRGGATPGLVIIPQAPGDGIYDATDCGVALPCTWTAANTYRLDGIVELGGGIVLNIEAGTRIEGNSAVNPSALYIRRDAQIFANGTALQPIVFTCTAAVKVKGCWAGLAIAGNAPVNLQQAGSPAAPDFARNPGGGGNTRLLEGTTAGTAPTMDFGGNNAADNSGTVRYTRIEYGGFVVGTNNELNGLTLGGVGSGTTLEFIQIHGGLDDGIEFFGGTANARNLVLTGNSDDAFDWSFGWQGSAQFVIVQMDSLDSEKGLEGDNSEGTGATFNESPRTNGPLYNFTLIGTLFPTSTAGTPGNNVNDAVHIRRGNRSELVNSIIAGYPVALDLDDAPTCANAAGDPAIRNTTFIANVVLGNADGSDPACLTGATEADVINAAANANTIVASVTGELVRPFDYAAPDIRPISGSTTATGTVAAPPAGNTFIQATTFRGAVPVAAAVTQSNISWYMGWTRGFQSATAP